MGGGFSRSDASLKLERGSLRNADDAGVEASQDSDESLMARFCDGELPAFEKLFQRYGRPIRAYLTRLVGPSPAEDLAQATFLSVVRARGRFDRKARFRPWLYTIATNAARDHLRRRRFEQLSADGELPLPGSDGALAKDAGLEQAIRAALEQLPPTQRLAVVMHRFQALSFAEIAEVLESSESVVKARARRGYERL